MHLVVSRRRAAVRRDHDLSIDEVIAGGVLGDADCERRTDALGFGRHLGELRTARK